jgi:hypothetical protein
MTIKKTKIMRPTHGVCKYLVRVGTGSGSGTTK